MLIRIAQSQDILRIREIYNQAVVERSATCDENSKTLEDRRTWFEQFSDSYPIFVLETDGVVAGYGCLFKYSPKSGYRYAVENSIYVAREFRGRGFGKLLLAHLISAAKERGYKYLEARIFEHNPTSLALHEQFGFKRVGVQERIANLDGQWFNNVILNLQLDGSKTQDRVFSNSPWEEKVGYCRAIKKRNFIAVSGTTSMKEGKVFAPGDAFAQATNCLEIIKAALEKLGASPADIIRTRMFVTDISRWEDFGKAHATFFGQHPPATAMYEIQSLIDPQLLIEIEADAVV